MRKLMKMVFVLQIPIYRVKYMIPLAENEISPLGKKYDNDIWIEVEQPQVPQPESDTEIIMQAITDLELQGIEAQRQNELLAQQITDIELMMLERGM